MQKVGDILTVIYCTSGHEFEIGEKIAVIDVLGSESYKCSSLTRPEAAWFLGPEEFFVSAPKLTPIAELQKRIYEDNVAAGWWSDLTTGKPHPKGDITLILSKLALVHSEVSEALEGVRKGLMDDKLPHRPMAEVEIADAIIRLLDLAGHEGYDVAGAIEEKLAYNSIRLDHKKEHRAAEGGKKV